MYGLWGPGLYGKLWLNRNCGCLFLPSAGTRKQDQQIKHLLFRIKAVPLKENSVKMTDRCRPQNKHVQITLHLIIYNVIVWGGICSHCVWVKQKRSFSRTLSDVEYCFHLRKVPCEDSSLSEVKCFSLHAISHVKQFRCVFCLTKSWDPDTMWCIWVKCSTFIEYVSVCTRMLPLWLTNVCVSHKLQTQWLDWCNNSSNGKYSSGDCSGAETINVCVRFIKCNPCTERLHLVLFHHSVFKLGEVLCKHVIYFSNKSPPPPPPQNQLPSGITLM